jgi:hypothetical protein
MLALIKQGDDLIVPNVNGELVRLADTLEEHFHEPELPQRPVNGNKRCEPH